MRGSEKRALPDVRLHDLRHSFASFLVNQGVSLYVVQGLLGHASPRMTQRYAHLAPQTLLDAAEVVSGVSSVARTRLPGTPPCLARRLRTSDATGLTAVALLWRLSVGFVELQP